MCGAHPWTPTLPFMGCYLSGPNPRQRLVVRCSLKSQGPSNILIYIWKKPTPTMPLSSFFNQLSGHTLASYHSCSCTTWEWLICWAIFRLDGRCKGAHWINGCDSSTLCILIQVQLLIRFVCRALFFSLVYSSLHLSIFYIPKCVTFYDNEESPLRFMLNSLWKWLLCLYTIILSIMYSIIIARQNTIEVRFDNTLQNGMTFNSNGSNHL